MVVPDCPVTLRLSCGGVNSVMNGSPAKFPLGMRSVTEVMTKVTLPAELVAVTKWVMYD